MMKRKSAVSRRGLFGWLAAATALPAAVAAHSGEVALTSAAKDAGWVNAHVLLRYSGDAAAGELYSRVEKRSL